MKTSALSGSRCLALTVLAGTCIAPYVAVGISRVAVFPEEDPLTPENFRLVWVATPGVRYEVRESVDLVTWSVVPGFPALAGGPAQQMPFAAEGQARFFQVHELDEQPPAIGNQYPKDDGFATRT